MGVATDARNSAEAAKSAYEGLNQEEIFKRLTNNGMWEGLYEGVDGNVYINASYIKSGEFVADLIKAGVLQSVDKQTFLLDLDNGILSLFANGTEAVRISPDGAQIAGWEINNKYLGIENAGLNGDIALIGTSAKSGLPSPVRFHAGTGTETQRRTVLISGKISNRGWVQGRTQLDYVAAKVLNESMDLLTIHMDGGDVDLTLDELGTFIPFKAFRRSPRHIMAQASVSNEEYYNRPFTMHLSYDSCIPAFQVLDDGSLIVEHAKIGGYSIADLVARIEALEGKVGS
jgi:hypothetical protein